MWTLSACPSRATSSVPSRSVRYVATPWATNRASVAGARCPNVFFAPTEIRPTVGSIALSRASVVAVRLPWWATLRTSMWGRPRATRTGSTPSSMSPVSRKRCEPTEPSSTIDTLLIPVPVSGGARGTLPGSGQSTRNETPSSAKRSPVERGALCTPRSESAASKAAYAGPGPVMPGSNRRPTR